MGVFAIERSTRAFWRRAAITISAEPITTLLTSFDDSRGDKKCRKTRVEIDVCDWRARTLNWWMA
jgi:hypothetical protein